MLSNWFGRFVAPKSGIILRKGWKAQGKPCSEWLRYVVSQFWNRNLPQWVVGASHEPRERTLFVLSDETFILLPNSLISLKGAWGQCHRSTTVDWSTSGWSKPLYSHHQRPKTATARIFFGGSVFLMFQTASSLFGSNCFLWWCSSYAPQRLKGGRPFLHRQPPSLPRTSWSTLALWVTVGDPHWGRLIGEPSGCRHG